MWVVDVLEHAHGTDAHFGGIRRHKVGKEGVLLWTNVGIREWGGWEWISESPRLDVFPCLSAASLLAFLSVTQRSLDQVLLRHIRNALSA